MEDWVALGTCLLFLLGPLAFAFFVMAITQPVGEVEPEERLEFELVIKDRKVRLIHPF